MNLGTLQITNPNGHVQEFVIPKTEIIVGRVPGTDLMLADTSVSRQHAKINVELGRLIIEDLNSANGTFVDGQRLNPHVPTPATRDQTVWFGDVVIKFFPPAVEQQTLIIESPILPHQESTLIYTPKPQAAPPVEVPAATPPVYEPPPPQPQYTPPQPQYTPPQPQYTPPQYTPEPQYAPPAYQAPVYQAPEPEPQYAAPQPPANPLAPAGQPSGQGNQRMLFIIAGVVAVLLICGCVICVGTVLVACGPDLQQCLGS